MQFGAQPPARASRPEANASCERLQRTDRSRAFAGPRQRREFLPVSSQRVGLRPGRSGPRGTWRGCEATLLPPQVGGVRSPSRRPRFSAAGWGPLRGDRGGSCDVTSSEAAPWVMVRP